MNQLHDARIGLIDIETSPLEAYTWGLWDQNVGLNQIKTEWTILSYSFKWLGESKIIYEDTGGKGPGKVRDDKRLLVRVTVEMLLRTGLRVSEFTGLRADAVVLIGAGPWLHVPVGKLREDRYLPLHPQLVTLPREQIRVQFIQCGARRLIRE